MTRMRQAGLLLATATLVAACGSSKNNTAATTTPTTAATTTTAAPTTTSTTVASTTTTVGQTITITPSTGLTNGQMVHVVGTGFTPGETNLGINECADKGNNTGAGDCDLAGTKVLKPDSSGKVTIDFAVKKGPFGSNNIVCSAAQACLLSISQLVASPTEQASSNITFAG
jgi:hypothetical protein